MEISVPWRSASRTTGGVALAWASVLSPDRVAESGFAVACWRFVPSQRVMGTKHVEQLAGLAFSDDRAHVPKMTRTKKQLDRYKHAADHALRQLDWCASYLESIHKDKAARALKQNRNFIAKQIGHD